MVLADLVAFESLGVGVIGMILGLSAACLMGAETGPLVVLTCHCRRGDCSGVRLVPAERLARYAG